MNDQANPRTQFNKTSYRAFRYLLYALGEIVLIVVGILLALYLDNINSEKQARETEIEMLEELRSNLVSNIDILNRTLRTESEYLHYNEMILDYLDDRKPYDETLDRAFAVYFWTISTNPVTGGYEFLKSKGIDLITNDSLRNEISFIFENEFSILKNENEVWSNNLQQNISYPYHVKHFRRYYATDENNNEIELARPFDYQSLLDDNEFKSINTEIISNRKWNINSLEVLIREIEHLIVQIDAELER
ncbi:hypothetical protein DDZ15_03395 [Rhodohalobacter mucosus]|uniref:Uncharacterized protein n=2 Tax=Rhodohalobacter mucosus TaxID=2079485 RepID=A0A316U2C4_9BACT|nr:hypothetical protein DDZ15_03395 [Rhodohalobacter mucosus]